MNNRIGLMLSARPDMKYSSQILRSPLVLGARMNTGAPVTGSKVSAVRGFRHMLEPKQAWIDLKCRELRLVETATIPGDRLELNHSISVRTPTAVYYNDGAGVLVVDRVEEGRFLVIRPPKMQTEGGSLTLGKGASLNIPDNTLHVDGFLTESDIEYIEACVEADLHNYLLSFVESRADLKQLRDLDPLANVILKVESKRGLRFVAEDFDPVRDRATLLLARGDLFVELDYVHQILGAARDLIARDPNAIAASRLLLSFMREDSMPSCADVFDVGYLLEIGYRQFLLGDEVCTDETTLSSVIGFFSALEKDYFSARKA
ncbi:MAG: hypothetical protein HXY34_00285 [Candidatus Thorarchaeota archaeon]|nr:hypothetical protein [Candidatus Thorarchaeota archaeon]